MTREVEFDNAIQHIIDEFMDNTDWIEMKDILFEKGDDIQNHINAKDEDL